MATEPHREEHEIEGRLRILARWVRKNTVQLTALNPFEPDHMWYGPTATELSFLFPGMHRTLADVKLMSRELVEFIRVNARCVRVGMMHIDIGATAPIIRMRIQSVALPSHLRGRETIMMTYAGLRDLNRYNHEVLYGLRTPSSENSSANRTAVQQLAAQESPYYHRRHVPPEVLAHHAYGHVDGTTIPTDQDYSRERVALLRACTEAAANAQYIRGLNEVLRSLGIRDDSGTDRPEGTGAGATRARDLDAGS